MALLVLTSFNRIPEVSDSKLKLTYIANQVKDEFSSVTIFESLMDSKTFSLSLDY